MFDRTTETAWTYGLCFLAWLLAAAWMGVA